MTQTRTETDHRGDGRNTGDRLRSAANRLPGAGDTERAQLVTEHGRTRISAGVVSKIAGFAAREIPGVYAMGGGLSRRVGQLKGMVGASQDSRQGVSVEVGERQTAVDLDIVTWYGQSIMDISNAVRSNVMDRVHAMTGLEVTEVNVNVDDVFVEGEDDDRGSSSR